MASRQDPNASSTGCEKTYQVLGKWPETLWKQRRISSVTYEKLLFLSRDGVVSRKRNLEAGQEHEEAAALKLAIRSNPQLYQHLRKFLKQRNG
jgi:hypothetical protein